MNELQGVIMWPLRNTDQRIAFMNHAARTQTLGVFNIVGEHIKSTTFEVVLLLFPP